MLTVHEAKQKIEATARENKEFAKLLQSDPDAAVKQLFNTDIPDGVKLTIHQESPDELHIVLPAENSDELSDLELDAVSGGTCWDHQSPFPPVCNVG